MKECSWLYSLSTVTNKVIRSVTNKAVTDLFIHLMLRISDQFSIDWIQRCKEMYHWLRIWQFKCNLFKCFSSLCRGRYDVDVFSVLCCFDSMLFIVKVYEISLHSWQRVRMNHLRQQRDLKMRWDLISEIIYTLSLIISEKGEETVKLNIEVRESFKTLKKFNVDSTVVF